MSELELNIGRFVIHQLSSQIQTTLKRKYQTLTTQQAMIDQLEEMNKILHTASENKFTLSESLSRVVERCYSFSKVLEKNLVNNRFSNEALLNTLQQNYITIEGLYTTVRYPGRLGLDIAGAVNMTLKSCDMLQCSLEDNYEMSKCLNASLQQTLDSNKTVMHIFKQSDEYSTDDSVQTMKTDVALAATMQQNWFLDQKLKSSHELNTKTMERLETCLQKCTDTLCELGRAIQYCKKLYFPESEDRLDLDKLTEEEYKQMGDLENADMKLLASIDEKKTGAAMHNIRWLRSRSVEKRRNLRSPELNQPFIRQSSANIHDLPNRERKLEELKRYIDLQKNKSFKETPGIEQPGIGRSPTYVDPQNKELGRYTDLHKKKSNLSINRLGMGRSSTCVDPQNNELGRYTDLHKKKSNLSINQLGIGRSSTCVDPQVQIMRRLDKKKSMIGINKSSTCVDPQIQIKRRLQYLVNKRSNTGNLGANQLGVGQSSTSVDPQIQRRRVSKDVLSARLNQGTSTCTLQGKGQSSTNIDKNIVPPENESSKDEGKKTSSLETPSSGQPDKEQSSSVDNSLNLTQSSTCVDPPGGKPEEKFDTEHHSLLSYFSFKKARRTKKNPVKQLRPRHTEGGHNSSITDW